MTLWVTWLSFAFGVHEMRSGWSDAAGVFMFCKRGDRGEWAALYVGEADSFSERIPTHESWSDARRLGATHVHALPMPDAAERQQLRDRLILALRPLLNVEQASHPEGTPLTRGAPRS